MNKTIFRLIVAALFIYTSACKHAAVDLPKPEVKTVTVTKDTTKVVKTVKTYDTVSYTGSTIEQDYQDYENSGYLEGNYVYTSIIFKSTLINDSEFIVWNISSIPVRNDLNLVTTIIDTVKVNAAACDTSTRFQESAIGDFSEKIHSFFGRSVILCRSTDGVDLTWYYYHSNCGREHRYSFTYHGEKS